MATKIEKLYQKRFEAYYAYEYWQQKSEINHLGVNLMPDSEEIREIVMQHFIERAKLIDSIIERVVEHGETELLNYLHI